MAKKVLIDEIYSKQAQDQILQLSKDLQGVVDLIGKINAKGLGGDAKTVSEAQKQTQDYARDVERLNVLKSEAGNIIQKNRQAVSEETRLQRLNAKATNEQISQYERLKAQLAIAIYNYQKLAAEYGKNSQQAKAAALEAKRLNDQVNGINQKIGIFHGTVGKYADSIMNSFKQIGLAIVAAFSFNKIVDFFKTGVTMSMAWEERNARMLFTLNNNSAAMERMQKFADDLARTSLFKKSDIVDAQILALQLGRTEEQTNKMITAAMGLARITGQDLSTAMQTMSMTLEGSKGRLGRIVGEIKGMTEEELKAGKAIDVVNDRFGRFGKEGLDTTKGRVVMLSKEWAGFQRKLVEGTGGKNIFAGLIDGARSLVGWLSNNIVVVGKIITEIGRFLTVVVAWKVGVMAASAAQTVWVTVTNLYSAAANRAKKETDKLNAAQKSNIWGLVASLIALAVTYLGQFIMKTGEAKKLQEEFVSSLSKGVGESNAMFDQLKKTNQGTKERSYIIKQLNEKYGEYLGNINLEKAGLLEIESAQQLVNNSLIEKILLETKSNEISKLAAKQTGIIVELQKKYGLGLKDINEQLGGGHASNEFIYQADKGAQALIDDYINLKDQIDGISKTYDSVASDFKKSLTIGGGSFQKMVFGDEEESKKTKKSGDNAVEAYIKWKKLIDTLQRYKDMLKPKIGEVQLTPFDPAGVDEINNLLKETVVITEELSVKSKFIWENVADGLQKVMPQIEKYANYASRLIDSIFDLSDVKYNNAENSISGKLKKDLDDLKEQYDRGLIMEEEYNRKKSELEKESEQKKYTLAKQRFEREKQQKMIQMWIDLAMAQMNIYATVTPWYLAVAESAIMGGLFTAQFEAVRQAQFPGYEKGRKGGKAEWAWVGEQNGGAFEYISTDTGLYKTPNKPTLTFLPQGADVLPHNVSKELDKYISMPNVQSVTKVPENSLNGELLKEVKKLNAKPSAKINIDKNGIHTLMVSAAGSREYLNKHVVIR